MLRVVLDANVLVSAILNPHGYPARILTAWREGAINLVLSFAVLDEIARVLAYPKLQKWHGWSADQSAAFVAELAALASVVPVRTVILDGAKDPDEGRYLACAIEGEADYIVSGDHHLLVLRRYHQIPILTPRLFVEVLNETGGSNT